MEQSVKFPQRRNQSRTTSTTTTTLLRDASRDIFKRARGLFASRVPNHYFARRLVDHNIKRAAEVRERDPFCFLLSLPGSLPFAVLSSLRSSENLSTLRFRPIIIRVPPAVPSVTLSLCQGEYILQQAKNS